MSGCALTKGRAPRTNTNVARENRVAEKRIGHKRTTRTRQNKSNMSRITKKGNTETNCAKLKNTRHKRPAPQSNLPRAKGQGATEETERVAPRMQRKGHARVRQSKSRRANQPTRDTQTSKPGMRSTMKTTGGALCAKEAWRRLHNTRYQTCVNFYNFASGASKNHKLPAV